MHYFWKPCLGFVLRRFLEFSGYLVELSYQDIHVANGFRNKDLTNFRGHLRPFNAARAGCFSLERLTYREMYLGIAHSSYYCNACDAVSTTAFVISDL